jgi:predicted transposase/invertase (TIGR01784 family)
MKTKVFFNDDDNIIDIRYDGIFKAVFTKDTPASQGALSALVSALIGRKVAIIRILTNEPPMNNIRDRLIRFDINCRCENGELIDVEMSFNPDNFEPVRLEFHAGKLFTGQDIKGVDKSYKDLKQAYQIAILGKEKFFSDDIFLHTFEYYDSVNKVSLNGRSRIITLELLKLDNIAEKPANEMKAAETWAVYLQYLTDKNKRSKINEIIEINEGVAMASEVLMTISQDEIERAWQMSEEKYQLDMQSRLTYAKEEAREKGRAEGLAEGRTEGRAEGRTEGETKKALEIARKMKASGKPLTEIAEFTEIPLSEIEKL